MISKEKHLDFDSAIPRFESWRPSQAQSAEIFAETALFSRVFWAHLEKWIPPAIRRFCAALFFQLLLRQQMRMPLAGRRQCAPHRFLGIAAIGLRGLVFRESAALALGQLGFLQLGHATVSSGIEREQLRHPVDLLTQRLHQLFHAGIGPRLAVPLPSPFSILRMIIGMPSLRRWLRMSSASA